MAPLLLALALTASTPPARCAPGMVWVAGGGPFELGMLEGSSERVAAFCLDRTEVTVRAYAACVSRGACSPAAATVQWAGLSDAERERWSALCNRDREDRAFHPVNCVDWAQAEAFCRAAGKRLPTEAEWEWAARNGARATRFPWGDSPARDRICWNAAAAQGGDPRRLTGTCEVGTHPAGDTPGGLTDLGGNVWEWTASENHGGPERVVRGGGWFYNSPELPSARYREWHPPSHRASTLGFRCAAAPRPAGAAPPSPRPTRPPAAHQ